MKDGSCNLHKNVSQGFGNILPLSKMLPARSVDVNFNFKSYLKIDRSGYSIDVGAFKSDSYRIILLRAQQKQYTLFLKGTFKDYKHSLISPPV